MYAVKVGQFEGPLDLLLEFIEKKKLSVNEVSLAEITDQYINYLKKLENFSLEEVAFFVLIASTLLLIKSRSLIPSLELSEDEEESIEDLEERLKTYRRIRELSLNIKNIFGINPLFDKEGFKGIELGFIEPPGLNTSVLHAALAKLLISLPIKECLPEAEVKKIISLEDKMNELIERIKNKLEVSFAEFSVSRDDLREEKKIEIIVSFLALLELTKRGIVIVNQAGLFGSITICQGNGDYRL